MSEALRMVKAEMGLDAMILSSKKERKKGIWGLFSKPYYEVTAALEPRQQQRPAPLREEPAPIPERELSTREEFQNSMLGPLAREVRELKQRIEALSRKEAQQAAQQQQPPQQYAEPQPESPAAPAAPRTFGREELEEIKQLLYNAVSGGRDKQPVPVTFPQAGGAPEPPAARAMAAQLEVLGVTAQVEPPRSEPAVAVLKLAEEALPAARQEPMAEPMAVSVAVPMAEPAVAARVESMVAPPAAELSEQEPLLEQLAQELRAQEVGALAIDILTESVRSAAHDGALLDELRSLMAENLAGMVKCSGALRIKKTGPRIVAVVGPTGVGKTTTIAKIAAMYALNRRVSVAMVTMDNFRVGAVEQLKTYAKIMDLPLEVAGTSQELSNALARHSDKDLILIDTAGRSPKDAERLNELKGYLETQSGIDVYLCVSATTRSREIDQIIETFGTLPITKLLFTKLDESTSFGCIVDTCLKHKIPLSYFSTGQKVPEDIEVASSRRLAAMVVQESNQ